MVQPRLRPEVWVSYAAYRDHLVEQVEAAVVPCLADDRPNLVVLPENAGLHAAFIGSRGALAREADTSIEAFLALAGPYEPAITYYESVFGPLDFAEGLVLALTDTVWRAFDGTMRDIAARTGAFVVANADVAGAITTSTDPAVIAALADPDEGAVSSVFVASERGAFNTAYVYAPDGAVAAMRRKPYLVPSEETDLRLSYGSLADVTPVDLGFAKLGIVTSKDAWMPDVLHRLDALGANLLVQPEAFGGWGIEELPGDWLPEVVTQSGWSAVQKHGSIRYAAIPHLTGNLFDLVFDGQSAIFGDARPGSARPAYVGLDPMLGTIAVAPWLADDPGASDPTLPLEQRRALLREAAIAVLPGGPRANGYVETVIAADLDLGPWPVSEATEAGGLGASIEVAPASAAEQTMPRVAASGSNVLVVWTETVSGVASVWSTRSSDGGFSFSAPTTVASGADAQITPVVAIRGDDAAVAWQARSPDGARVMVARSSDGGASFGAAVSPGAATAGADEWLPSIALDASGEALVAFVSGETENERIMLARSAGTTWAVAPVDAPAALPAPNPRNNQWSPSVAVDGSSVAVAWVDFRAFQWDALVARSDDGGATFGPPERVDDAGDAPERLHDDPRLAFDGASLACAWTDVRARRAPARARAAAITGGSPSPSEALGSPAEASPPSFRPAIAADLGGLIAAWQDVRDGKSGIYASRVGTGTQPLRIDDGGGAQQLAPDVAATAGGALVVVWEDTRTGQRRVRAARGVMP